MSSRVLIVDDSALVRRMLRDVLEASGRFTVAGEATSGLEAVRLYAEVHPDLVTMDIVMPEMDGIEAVRRIVAADPRARIVMISAHGQEGLVMESLVAGAAEFVAKPLDPPRVLEALDRAVATASA